MASVLVVDDDDDIRELFAEYLRLGGHQVYAADGSGLAIKHAARYALDVIVLDWQLQSEPSGAALIERLRQYSSALVVVMSAEPTALLEAYAASVEACLLKPFRLEELQALISELLTRGPSPLLRRT